MPHSENIKTTILLKKTQNLGNRFEKPAKTYGVSVGAEPGDDNTQCCSPYVKMAIAFSQIKNQHIATVAFGMPKTNQLTSFFFIFEQFLPNFSFM